MITRLIMIILFATLPFFVTSNSSINSSIPAARSSKTISIITTPKPKRHTVTDTIKHRLIKHVNQYIHQSFPKSRLSGKALVNACTKHKFDLIFALAQGRIESGFGTAGVARKTNSVWNVGAWDGRSIETIKRNGHKYEHPDMSIEPYIMHIKAKYMGDDKDEKDLMKNYVSLAGHRYASSSKYESKLRSVYQDIKQTELGRIYRIYIKNNL